MISRWQQTYFVITGTQRLTFAFLILIFTLQEKYIFPTWCCKMSFWAVWWEELQILLSPVPRPCCCIHCTSSIPFRPWALEIHKDLNKRGAKLHGQDYILVRFFSPLGQPPLNPPLPWLESEQGKAGWTEKKGTHMSNEVLHCCKE